MKKKVRTPQHAASILTLGISAATNTQPAAIQGTATVQAASLTEDYAASSVNRMVGSTHYSKGSIILKMQHWRQPVFDHAVFFTPPRVAPFDGMASCLDTKHIPFLQ